MDCNTNCYQNYVQNEELKTCKSPFNWHIHFPNTHSTAVMTNKMCWHNEFAIPRTQLRWWVVPSDGLSELAWLKKKSISMLVFLVQSMFLHVTAGREPKVNENRLKNKKTAAFTFRGFCWRFHPKRLTTSPTHILTLRRSPPHRAGVVRGEDHCSGTPRHSTRRRAGESNRQPSGYQSTRSTSWATAAYSPPIFKEWSFHMTSLQQT